MNHKRKIVLQSLVITLALALTVLTANQYAAAKSSVEAESYAAQTDPADHEDGDGNCRYGVTTRGNAQVPFVDNFHAGWYLNFSYAAADATNDAEFVPMIEVKQDKDSQGNYLPTYSVSPSLTAGGLGAQIQNSPGALWIVGNEVDRIGIQGDTYPDVYARAYHDIYHFIKEHDPSAQVGISGLVQVTPGRLQYLDLVWEAYLEQFGHPMPVDVWTMHIYILPERSLETGEGTTAQIALGTDPALAIWDSANDSENCPREDVYCYAEHDDIGLFADQVEAMRTWMKEHGQQNKPLILSEYSILYVFVNYDDPINPTQCYLMDEFGECFTQPRVSNFMLETFDYLETATNPNLGYPADGNRLVQQWLWYAIHTPVDETGGSSNLMNDALTQFTQVGQTFHDEVAARSLTTNLFPHEVRPSVGFSSAPTATVQITATVRNNGNANAGGPFHVTFYEDQARTIPIGSVEIPGPTSDNAGMVGCARKAISASVTWSDLTPGLHRYWVEVDSNAVITESNENDNVKSGLVFIDPAQTFLPTFHK